MNFSAFEAETRLSELLDRAAAGEVVVITKHGRPYVRLVPASSATSQEEIQALIERVRRRRRALPKTSWTDLKQDLNQGRRF